MQNAQTVKTVNQPPAQGLSLGDIYYVLFRHKWKILLFSAAGVIAAVVLFLARSPVYYSEAKILVRYVLESRSLTPPASDSQIKSPDSGGENIINSELEILTSLDLALVVADAVGPEKILARMGGGTNRNAAAWVIRKGLMVEVPRNSTIIRIRFGHVDPEIVRPVLSQVVDGYRKKHLEIHQGVGILDDFFSRQADQIRARLTQTEDELKQFRTESRVFSLEDMKKAYIFQISRIQQDLLTAEAELAERKAALEEVQKKFGTNDQATAEGVPAESAAQYRTLFAQLDAFKRRRQELLFEFFFTEENPLVKRLQAQIDQTEKEKRKMEAEHPKLAALSSAFAGTNAATLDLPAEAARVASLAVKIKVLNDQLQKTSAEATRIVEAEPRMTQLQRKKELEEAAYRYYSSSLEQARVDESLGIGKITNLSVVQAPSPPARDNDEWMKPVAAVLAAGVVGGLMLAFLLERVFDQSIKRVSDVERHTGIPLFLSIPDARWNGRMRFRKIFRNGHPSTPPTLDTPSSEAVQPAAQRGEVAPWGPPHTLHVYYDALRDRLITYFEVRNMTHKPKLVAVTSCNRGAGVTTLAAGLAASLSETGDGNVLLVDMNLDQGAAAYPFHNGSPGCGLSEALDLDKPGTALVREKLYLVSAHETKNGKLPRTLPKRFAHLVPSMKASDYDYIIFDMPPVTQTSVTARLSGFMDMVLMVIESEKTGQEIAKRAQTLLQECRANVTAVLNKNRAYVPERLREEL